MKKRGLSKVVTTLILILLVIVSIWVVWEFISKIFITNSEQISTEKFTTSLKLKNIKINKEGNSVSLNVKRNVGKGNLKGINFIFSDGKNSENFEEDNIDLEELGEMNFSIVLKNLNISELKTISIAPIFKSISGKKIYGGILDTYTIPSYNSQIYETPQEDTNQDEETPEDSSESQDPIHKGDFLIFGYKAVNQENENYENQSNLEFFETISKDVNDYPLFWTESSLDNLLTWDDTNFPMGEKYYWYKIEISQKNMSYPQLQDMQTLVILRPTQSMKNNVNIDEMVKKYNSTINNNNLYNEPFFPLLIKWTRKLSQDNHHWLSVPGLLEQYTTTYGINFSEIPIQEKMQTSKYLGNEYTDINNSKFYERSMDSSSLTAWAMIYGWYSQDGESVRNTFINNFDKVASIDAIYPGQLAWWLVKNNMAQIIDCNCNGFECPTCQSNCQNENNEDCAVPAITNFELEPRLPTDSTITFSYSVIDNSNLNKSELYRAPFDQTNCNVENNQGCTWSNTPVKTQEISGTTYSGNIDDTIPLGSFLYKLKVIDESNNLAKETIPILVTRSSASETHTIYAHKGDFLFYGNRAVKQEDTSYDAQTYLAFFETISKKLGIYTPLWEDNGNQPLLTWDDTNFPMGEKYYWVHAEVVQQSGIYSPLALGNDGIILVLHPTITMQSHVDTDKMAERYTYALSSAGPYNQPFFPIFMKYTKKLSQDNNHWLSIPELLEQYTTTYGININEIPVQEKMQTSTSSNNLMAYTDIAYYKFWERSTDCSSITSWAMTDGWYNKEGESVREFFRNNLTNVAAVDSISPGQLAWWLNQYNWAQIIDCNCIDNNCPMCEKF